MIKTYKQFVNELFETDLRVKPHEKLLIDAVINFFKNQWNFKAKVIVKKKDNDNQIGDISLSDAAVNRHKFTLHFNPNQSTLYLIKTLIHELTHINQVVKGELRPNDTWDKILWKDDFSITLKEFRKTTKNFKEYSNLPWEVEAYKNQKDKSLLNKLLRSSYWKELKGKDATLDFIIDNL